ncbi:hypothetical protein V1J52_22700 [Streptomyces sp. TRM 70351]|uniref:hypothetical protein n=1 Tax=Streptomyces sp. TRM 70351 TaxID=3116552 RepID=UPI002E7B46B0|nr:hypothetical protein [Streptomyces sp. TRM 70351]MEE1930952.1 hypothetical protein [Streptomyces sp. TRM 70351]
MSENDEDKALTPDLPPTVEVPDAKPPERTARGKERSAEDVDDEGEPPEPSD